MNFSELMLSFCQENVFILGFGGEGKIKLSVWGT